MATTTTLQVGTYNQMSDTFTSVLDLNDRVTFFVQDLALPQPAKLFVKSGNIHVPGEAVENWQYQNRMITATLMLAGANATALLASVRNFFSAIETPPYTLGVRLAGASNLTYFTCVKVEHVIPYRAQTYLSGVVLPIEVHFECLPRGFTIPRQQLSNLVANPGFEAPYGGGNTQNPPIAFTDTFANVNAYTSVLGSAPTASGNVLTVPANSRAAFGSPAWSAYNSFTVRFQWVAAGLVAFDLHRVDANNFLTCQVDSILHFLHVVGGTAHDLGGGTAVSLTNGAWYWIGIIQFPSVSGNPPMVQALLFSDSAGSVGSLLASVGPVATYDAVTALVGRPALGTGGSAISFGGAFANVCYVKLFGPGGWGFTGSNGGSTGVASGAWDGTRTELGMSGTATLGTGTYNAGPATSFGAARIDLAPAGTANAYWESYSGGTPNSYSPSPDGTVGNVLRGVAHIRSSGLAASATITLQMREWDGSGLPLRATTLQSVSGNQASWTTLSGAVTTGANTVYVSLQVQVVDATTASAGATVWIDNTQMWNQTVTGQTSMPYCELRFPSSPAQLLVSGIIGDTVAPVYLALGTYLASFPTGTTLTYTLGRCAQVRAGAQLVSPIIGSHAAPFTPIATPASDATSYGGFYESISALGSAGWQGRPLSPAPAALGGTFDVRERFYSAQSSGNLPNISVRTVAQVQTTSWFGLSDGSSQLSAFAGLWYSPVSSSSAWGVYDGGQLTLPFAPPGSQIDLTQNYITPRLQWVDSSGGGGAAARLNWAFLLPVDASLLTGTLINPGNNVSYSSQWVWSYLDGLPMGVGGTPATSLSLENWAWPDVAHSAGGSGTTGSGTLNINMAGDQYLTIDPRQSIGGVAGINQFGAAIVDQNATVLPIAAEIAYSPQYLFPQ